MQLIELHILQSFPVTCLNRDDLNAPKTAFFGGALRARVSSQSWKRAMRMFARDEQGTFFAGERSHHMIDPLTEAIKNKGIDSDTAQEWAEEILTTLGTKDGKSKEKFKTAVSLYLSPQELDGIAQSIKDQIDDKTKDDKKKINLKKAIQDAQPKDLADIAIFGRMVASDHSLQVEGAGLFSHALSTHEVANEIDFFSAIDDLQPQEVGGAGHIGTLEYSSACYYRYIGLNLDLLWQDDHLGALDGEERTTTLNAFLRAALMAVPNARKNSMFGQTVPSHVLGLARRGQPLSLVNAFEAPIRSRNGFAESSEKALTTHYESVRTTYGLTGYQASMPDKDLNSFCSELVEEALKNGE